LTDRQTDRQTDQRHGNYCSRRSCRWQCCLLIIISLSVAGKKSQKLYVGRIMEIDIEQDEIRTIILHMSNSDKTWLHLPGKEWNLGARCQWYHHEVTGTHSHWRNCQKKQTV